MAIALDAPAKINLYLAVLGRRSDGFHEVETVLHELALHDTLTVEAHGNGDELFIEQAVHSGLAVHADASNLVCRAAERFRKVAGVTGGCRFHLCKRIPAGGGLGGGSSDAAAALFLLNTLHNFPLSCESLHDVAASIGSDVPFFLQRGTQLCRGRGDQLSPLASPRLHFVLLVPRVGTSTEAVYKKAFRAFEQRRRGG